jgi:hypothetical protein
MSINPDAFDDYEEGLTRPGGGGGGKKKEGFGAQNRDKAKRNEMKTAAKEGDPRKKEALTRVSEKVERALEKDKSADVREVREYFEWLRLGLLCAREIDRMKSDGSGDPELAWEMIMKKNDLNEGFVRSAGAGGQNVNKVNSAVQLSHIPSGIFVKTQESRDQSKNREKARERLQEKIMEHLTNWKKVIGDRSENEVMAEVFQGVLEKNQVVKGVKGDRLRKIETDLKEGFSL